MEITLKKPELETLRVNIGETVVEIPLGNSITVDEYAELSSVDGTINFYKKYIPKDIAKTLTFAEYNQITTAWVEATKKSTKMGLGEQ